MHLKRKIKIIGISFLILIIFLTSAYFYLVYLSKKEKLKQIPEIVWNCLDHPYEMTLYSIEPDLSQKEMNKIKENKSNPFFHEYVILGSTKIEGKKNQVIVANEIRNAVMIMYDGGARCFNPRHGVRVTDGKITYDFLICFSCGYMSVYNGEELIEHVDIEGSYKVLNEILVNANVPLAVRGK